MVSSGAGRRSTTVVDRLLAYPCQGLAKARQGLALLARHDDVFMLVDGPIVQSVVGPQ
jgi:hypothetical protein